MTGTAASSSDLPDDETFWEIWSARAKERSGASDFRWCHLQAGEMCGLFVFLHAFGTWWFLKHFKTYFNLHKPFFWGFRRLSQHQLGDINSQTTVAGLQVYETYFSLVVS